MTIGAIGRKSLSAIAALAAWTRSLSLFTLAAALALSGHVLLAFLLNGLKALGVDFETVDPGHALIPAAQIFLFALQMALIVIALVRSGIETPRTIIAIAALIWASAMLMLTFVSAQCDLYGACL